MVKGNGLLIHCACTCAGSNPILAKCRVFSKTHSSYRQHRPFPHPCIPVPRISNTTHLPSNDRTDPRKSREALTMHLVRHRKWQWLLFKQASKVMTNQSLEEFLYADVSCEIEDLKGAWRYEKFSVYRAQRGLSLCPNDLLPESDVCERTISRM